MSYVLTIVHPPVAPAAFGKSLVSAARPSQLFAAELAVHQLTLEGVDRGEASRFAASIWSASEEIGKEVRHEPTGLTFRIDPADNAPHSCPCDGCGRLVLPTDHRDAGMEDAYCLGCFTWNRDDIQCLPANTAHTEEP